MYRYDEFDEALVRTRAAQFRDQVARRLDGSLSEEEFRPLRLMNGLYLQLHAYMLRVAVPYGTLDGRQLRQLAMIADRYDKGYGHLTTRQNIQFNWPRLIDTPDILDALADVEMHAIQTSGNCIRNVTADHFAGVAADEVSDPRPVAELIRQWSTLHPEFSFLPRKFKIAVSGGAEDRAAVAVHDIGIRIVRNAAGEIGYKILVGGGLGRTPFVGKTVREFLPEADLLAYLEAILRVYNLSGRRDNKYKARIKILVHETGTEDFIAQVEAVFATMDGPTVNADPAEVARIAAYFAPPAYDTLPATSPTLDAAAAQDPALAAFVATNLTAHKVPGYTAVTVSAKPIDAPPGDVSSDQLRAIADLAGRFSFDEARITHMQNVVLPHVRLDDVPALFAGLRAAGLGTANAGLISDIISCPGLDYCTLATARSIPVAMAIQRHFADDARQREIGQLGIKISGCINACGHHHVGGIGILGLDKSGQENYQVTLGGDPGGADEAVGATLGERLGPGIDAAEVPHAIERLVDTYLAERAHADEPFIATVRRVGAEPFRAAFVNQGAGAEALDAAA